MWQTPVSNVSPANTTPFALELRARRRDVRRRASAIAEECGAVNSCPMFVGSSR